MFRKIFLCAIIVIATILIPILGVILDIAYLSCPPHRVIQRCEV